MKNNTGFFNRIPNSFLFMSIVSIFFLKLIIYILIKNNILNISLGGGSDANYYDLYAQGSLNVAANIWPVILRSLNDLNLYSRDLISYLLLFLNLSFIPLLVCKLAGLNYKRNQKYYFYLFLLCSVYVTLFFFTFDIYRDVFMVFSFLVGCLIVKKALSSSNILTLLSLLVVAALIGIFLAGLRPYLGYAFLLSLWLWKIEFTKKKIIFLGTAYFLVLFIANYAGVLDILTEYRAGFEESEGGSNLGLNFSNPVLFIPNFILSFLGQMFGLYVTNPLALVLFFVETIPFLFMLVYVVKNIKLADKFVRFLIIFFVIYASVWLIGNDNLGTAVRLRLYNYLAIYISFFYILRVKYNAKKDSINIL